MKPLFWCILGFAIGDTATALWNNTVTVDMFHNTVLMSAGALCYHFCVKLLNRGQL